MTWKLTADAKQPSAGHRRVFGFLSLPIRHYVGWTSHADPYTWLRWHGLGPPFRSFLASATAGTLADEAAFKESGTCPRCGRGAARRPAGPEHPDHQCGCGPVALS